MIFEEQRKNILVTGATGFIGSFLCPRLMLEGYHFRFHIMDDISLRNDP